MKQLTASVISNKSLWEGKTEPGRRGYAGAGLIWLKCPEIAAAARPGQFVMLRCGDCTLPRPFSIHRVNEKGELALFYAVVEDGPGTRWLSERKIDDELSVFGPQGNGFTIMPQAKRLLLVAGGNGIAPLTFLAQQALAGGHPVTLLYGTANNLRYPWRLLPSGIDLVDITEDGSAGKKGKATDFVPQFAHFADQVFACGPPPMYRQILENKEQLGLEGKPVQLSLEARMGCGRGVCYSCTVKTSKGLQQVCRDGPVFDLDDISELPLI